MVYFQTLYKYVPDTIELDFPVVLLESAIIKDTVDDKTLLRNTFENIGEQNIIAIAISISAKDVFGNNIDFNSESSFEYIYQDMVFEPHSKFGNKIAIDLPENARKVAIEIKSIALGNGKTINSNLDNIVNIPKRQNLKCHREYLTMFDDNKILPQFYYSESSDAWQCACGEINKISDDFCRKCCRTQESVSQIFNESHVEAVIQNINEQERIQKELERQKIDKLKDKTDEKTIKENEETQIIHNRTESSTQHRHLSKRKIGIYIGSLACVIICVWLLIINTDFFSRNNSYQNQSNVVQTNNQSSIHIDNNKTYQYEQDGFPGLPKPIYLESSYSNIKNISLNQSKCNQIGYLLQFENVELFNQYEGKLMIALDDSNIIKDITFDFTNSNQNQDIISTINEYLSNPYYQDNFDNMNNKISCCSWKLDDNHILTYNNTREKDNAQLVCEYINTDIIEEYQKCMTQIDEQSTLKNAFDDINKRVSYIGTSIEDLMNLQNVTFLTSDNDSAKFKEDFKLFGHDGFFCYYVGNPLGEYYDSDFLGQITTVSFYFNYPFTEDDKKDIINQMMIIYGTPYEDSFSELTWSNEYASPSTYFRCIDPSPCIQFKKNTNFFKIDADLVSQYCIKEPEIPNDCDPSILHFDNN